jgi:hypothetical protein
MYETLTSKGVTCLGYEKTKLGLGQHRTLDTCSTNGYRYIIQSRHIIIIMDQPFKNMLAIGKSFVSGFEGGYQGQIMEFCCFQHSS